MKVISVVTGIGYGDAIRENIILEKLKKILPDVQIRILGYQNSYEFFKDKYPTIKIKGYTFTGYNLRFQLLGFMMLNLILPFTWLVDTLKVLRLWKDFKPDIIISDFEPLGLILAKIWKKPCFTIFGFDPKTAEKYADNHKITFKQWLEIKYLNFLSSRKVLTNFFVPSFFPKKDYDKFKFVNLIVRDIPSKDVNTILADIKPEYKPIIIMMGGSSYGLTLTNKILKHLTDFKEEFIIFGYITNFSRENVKAFQYKEDFLKYLMMSKGIITLAGHETLSEALFSKKPALVFPIEDHIEQLINAYEVAQFFQVGDVNDIKGSVERFIMCINDLEEKISNINVKINGEEQIVKTILQSIR